METGWPYDAGTSDIGDWPDEQLADRAAARWQPSLEAPAAPGPSRCGVAPTMRAERRLIHPPIGG